MDGMLTTFIFNILSFMKIDLFLLFSSSLILPFINGSEKAVQAAEACRQIIVIDLKLWAKITKKDPELVRIFNRKCKSTAGQV